MTSCVPRIFYLSTFLLFSFPPFYFSTFLLFHLCLTSPNNTIPKLLRRPCRISGRRINALNRSHHAQERASIYRFPPRMSHESFISDMPSCSHSRISWYATIVCSGMRLSGYHEPIMQEYRLRREWRRDSARDELREKKSVEKNSSQPVENGSVNTGDIYSDKWPVWVHLSIGVMSAIPSTISRMF